ncbi:hypothetical protein STENM327S_00398 [Streptomyces tendae]
MGDSGGRSKAPLRVLESSDKVGRLLAVAQQGIPDAGFHFLELNGGPALLVSSSGKPDSAIQVDVADGRIQAVYIIRNPDKLVSLAGHSRPAPPLPVRGIGLDQGGGRFMVAENCNNL